MDGGRGQQVGPRAARVRSGRVRRSIERDALAPVEGRDEAAYGDRSASVCASAAGPTVGASGGGDASHAFSARTMRFGTASRSTSLTEPAARSATRRARVNSRSGRTGMGDTTLSIDERGRSLPSSATTSTTKASIIRPADRSGTFTRTPGVTSETSGCGMA